MEDHGFTGRAGLIKASAAARMLGVAPGTLARWSDSGVLPDPVLLGPGPGVYYDEADIDALLHGGGLDELTRPWQPDRNI
jgi:hypothetical protein